MNFALFTRLPLPEVINATHPDLGSLSSARYAPTSLFLILTSINLHRPEVCPLCVLYLIFLYFCYVAFLFLLSRIVDIAMPATRNGTSDQPRATAPYSLAGASKLQLAAFTAAALKSHLKHFKLSVSGTKATLVD